MIEQVSSIKLLGMLSDFSWKSHVKAILSKATQRLYFLERVSIACYAERCISYDRFCLTVRLTVCHTLVSCQNDLSYDHGVFTGG